MQEYTVYWVINVEAENERGAALQAYEIQRRATAEDYTANQFYVTPMSSAHNTAADLILDNVTSVDLSLPELG